MHLSDHRTTLTALALSATVFAACGAPTEDQQPTTETESALGAAQPCVYIGGSPPNPLKAGRTYYWYNHVYNSGITAKEVQLTIQADARLLDVWTFHNGGIDCDTATPDHPGSAQPIGGAFCKLPNVPFGGTTVYVKFQIDAVPIEDPALFSSVAVLGGGQINDPYCAQYASRLYVRDIQ